MLNADTKQTWDWFTRLFQFRSSSFASLIVALVSTGRPVQHCTIQLDFPFFSASSNIVNALHQLRLFFPPLAQQVDSSKNYRNMPSSLNSRPAKTRQTRAYLKVFHFFTCTSVSVSSIYSNAFQTQATHQKKFFNLYDFWWQLQNRNRHAVHQWQKEKQRRPAVSGMKSEPTWARVLAESKFQEPIDDFHKILLSHRLHVPCRLNYDLCNQRNFCCPIRSNAMRNFNINLPISSSRCS